MALTACRFGVRAEAPMPGSRSTWHHMVASSPGDRERAAPARCGGTIPLKIELEISQVDWLVAFGYLRQVERGDLKRVRAALYWFLDRTLKGDVTSSKSKM